jgi:hypothetical protein
LIGEYWTVNLTSPLWPSSRASAPSALLAAAVVAVALLLGLPATSFAAGGDHSAAGSRIKQGGFSETALMSAGRLARGSGYGDQNRSKAVRQLQLRLRRLGHRPGPIDGLFGPLTEASVERFQRAHGLRVDGVVGARTRARLLARSGRRPAAPHGHASPKPGAPDRAAPNRPAPATVAPPQHPAPEPAVRPAVRGPEGSDGLDPWLAALFGALAMGVLLAGLSRLGRPRRGEPAAERRGPAPRSLQRRLNLGMAFAVLLAVFATGAAIGAVFATQAAPGERDGAEVASGALLSTQAASPVQDARPAERPPAPVAAAEKPSGSYTAGPDDSLSSSPEEQPEVDGSEAAGVRRVQHLVDLNLEDRFVSGDPDLRTAGEKQGLP